MRSGLCLLPFAFPLALAAHQRRTNHRELSRHAKGDLLDKRDTYSGVRWTYYSTGLGACGGTNSDSDFIVALNQDTFGTAYPSEYCNKQITMTYNGKTTTATIVDSCPGCPSPGGLDLSPGLFSFFADESVGVLYGDWSFVDGSGGSGGDTTTSTTQQKTTTTAAPPTHTTTSTTKAAAPTTTTQEAKPTTSTTVPAAPKVTTTKAKPTTSITEAEPTTTTEVKPTTSTKETTTAEPTTATEAPEATPTSASDSDSNDGDDGDCDPDDASDGTEDAEDDSDDNDCSDDAAPSSTEAAPTTTETPTSSAVKVTPTSSVVKVASSSIVKAASSSVVHAAVPTTTPTVVGNVASQPEADTAPTSSAAAVPINGGLSEGTGRAVALSFSSALMGAVVLAVAAVLA